MSALVGVWLEFAGMTSDAGQADQDKAFDN